MKELRYKNKLSMKNRMMRLLWGVTYRMFFVLSPPWILNNWRVFLLKLFGAKVGVGCKIDPSIKVWAPWNLIIGDYVALGEKVNLYSVDRIEIGSKVAISDGSFICTASHDISSLVRPLTHSPIYIEDHCWIASQAMLHPGITIKEGSIVAARSVIRKSTNSWEIWAGNPGTMVGNRIIK
ncbi:hypothetical protein KDX00_16750 [Cobetia amphilecti]|nr:hypothetical protein KDX00_16750 [Cobetia litoralis]